MEGKAKIINFSNGLDNLDKLADFLEKRIIKKYSRDIYFHIEDVNDEYILGCIDGARFMVYYEPSQRMTLEMSQGFPNAKAKLMQVLEPIMWNLDENANNPEHFVRPILSYKTHNKSEVTEWETFDPMKKLSAFAFDYYSGADEDVYDVEIYYPETTLETLKESIKYGNFTGCIAPAYLEEVNNFTELELYLHIKGTLDTYEKYEQAAQLLEVNAEEKLDMTAYLLCYLMQQTPKFEVPCNPPSEVPVEPTAHQLAWIRWWSEKINEIEPEKFEEWKDYKYKIDPNFKPNGDYKEYIKIIEEECPLFCKLL